MMEMETLSPMTLLNPDETIVHTEEWELITGVDVPSNDENEIDKVVEKYIKVCKCCK
jgi:hypothetical protein